MAASGNIQPAIDRFEKQLKAQDGHFKLEPCRSEELEYIVAGDGPYDQFAPKQDVEPAYTCACGNVTRASYPYAGEDGEHRVVIVCVICDAATRFPRFKIIEALPEEDTAWE